MELHNAKVKEEKESWLSESQAESWEAFTQGRHRNKHQFQDKDN